MVKKRKRVLAILVVLTMLISIMPAGTLSVKAAGTTLKAGDIVILEFNGNGQIGDRIQDGFSFMPLVYLASGTTINFTDHGWNGSSFHEREDTSSHGNMITYTAPSGGVAAGTIIRSDVYNMNSFEFTPYYSSGDIYSPDNYINNFNTGSGHDGIIAFQGTPENPTFLWALQTGSWGGTDYYFNSELPTGLTDGMNAIHFPDLKEGTDLTVDDGYYNGPTTMADAATWRSRVANRENWVVLATGIQPARISATSYPVMLSIMSHPSNATVNAGGNSNFTVVASEATSYQWQVDYGSGFYNIANGGIYSGASTATLNISGAIVAMSGYKYRVLVSGTGLVSAISSAATLTVNTVPEIEVMGGGIAIADGDDSPSTADQTDFGSVSTFEGTVVHTFTIMNIGMAPLTLGGESPYVTLGGENAGDFSVTTIPTS